MHRPNISLSAKIVFCLGANLAALAVGTVWFVSQQSGEPGFIAEAVTKARFQDFATEAKNALETNPKENWGTILTELGEDHGVELGLFGPSLDWVAGLIDEFPESARPPGTAAAEQERANTGNQQRNQRGPDGPYRIDFDENWRFEAFLPIHRIHAEVTYAATEWASSIA
ncbi:MAG: hypothetical protein AAF585_18415 [Verrucomicrobiota bacterium]